MAADLVDDLLERYLGLLHEYTELRSQLSAHQATMFGHLARANFAAERGLRYGPDHFDGRMQAVVRLDVSEDSSSAEKTPLFAVVRPKKEVPVEAADAEKGGDDSEDKKEAQQEDGDIVDGAPEKNAKSGKNKKKKPTGPRDPLQWFGVLTPMALRQAQQEAITAIDALVPRLASISAEMAAVEIAVRRARKKRARAAAAQDKEMMTTTTATAASTTTTLTTATTTATATAAATETITV
ncbi:MAG: hypothetical protein STHCBS139747_007121 [Sporothrix thermara]